MYNYIIHMLIFLVALSWNSGFSIGDSIIITIITIIVIILAITFM